MTATVAPDQVTLALLVGGRSRRMGRDKATLEVAPGVTLGSLPLRALAPLASRVLLAGRAVPGLRGEVVADARPASGPLGGIVAALGAACTPYVLVAACDMPRVRRELAGLLLERLAGEPEADAALCRSGRGVEPLLAAFRPAAAGPLGAALERHRLALAQALAGLRLAVVEPAAWRRVDPDGRSFENWNEPRDLPAQTTV